MNETWQTLYSANSLKALTAKINKHFSVDGGQVRWVINPDLTVVSKQKKTPLADCFRVVERDDRFYFEQMN